MKKIKIMLLILIILINTIFLTGCWNYREVDQLAIVSGVAVDKGANGQYQLTPETIQMSGGKETKISSKSITLEGKTIFDAARNMISISGKRLYWSHSKVIILSKEIASDGVSKALEFYNRDSETREDVNILISEDVSAKAIFAGQKITEDIKAMVLSEMIKNQVSLSKAPTTNILKYDMESKTKGISTIIPAVRLMQADGNMTPQIMGTGIIKKDKLVGFLNGEETKDLLFIRNEVKGGVLIEEVKGKGTPTVISLEIFNNKTKVTPIVDGKDIKINVDIDTTVAIDEIVGTVNFIDETGQMKLEQSAANTLKKRVEAIIKKMQSKYAADIFGFGTKLGAAEPQVWKSVGDNWENVFKNLKVDVKTRVHIKNSAVLSKSLGAGD